MAKKPNAKGKSAPKRPAGKKAEPKKPAPAPRAKKFSGAAPEKGPVALLLGTRKGGFILKSDPARKKWALSGPFFLGNLVHHFMLDPRDGRTLLLAAKTGHLGPTVFRSRDFGKTWKEAARPPAFPKAPEGKTGRAVDHVFWLTPGHPSEPNVWYAGTSPQGLFRSADGGSTWDPVSGFNDHPSRGNWFGGETDGTPDGPKTHSIRIDPRNPTHMYLGLSGGGVFETFDQGLDWHPLNGGSTTVFGDNPPNLAAYDPHCFAMHPMQPDILYQQNHCGIYRMNRSEGKWTRIGNNMPKKIGDIGFPIVLHPRDANTAWVFPMDGTEVWPRTSPEGKPAAYVTRDGGKSWGRQDAGLPKANGWFTVFRQAMAADGRDPVGVYFGTTCGELWGSRDEGKKWECLARSLPDIFSVEAAAPAR